jgi:hypothetical protein
VRDVLKDKEFKVLFDSLDHIALTELAAFLVSYFEDLISDLGLWRAFRNEHERFNYDRPTQTPGCKKTRKPIMSFAF